MPHAERNTAREQYRERGLENGARPDTRDYADQMRYRWEGGTNYRWRDWPIAVM
jgi:hypothetical protein